MASDNHHGNGNHMVQLNQCATQNNKHGHKWRAMQKPNRGINSMTSFPVPVVSVTEIREKIYVSSVSRNAMGM